jgi:hypothetical protein
VIGMPGVLFGIAGDQRGNAAVEFALIGPLLVLLIVGSFELAVTLLVGGSLESAVLAASRYGVTGYSDGTVSREDRIRAIIDERTMGLIDLERTTIDTVIYPSFSDIGRPEPFTDSNRNGKRDTGESFTDINGNGKWDQDMGRSGAGASGDVVLYRVSYETRTFSRLLEPILGRILHRATVAVRNEPY